MSHFYLHGLKMLSLTAINSQSLAGLHIARMNYLSSKYWRSHHAEYLICSSWKLFIIVTVWQHTILTPDPLCCMTVLSAVDMPVDQLLIS